MRNAAEAAGKLLSAAGGPDLAQFYKEFDANQATLEAAAKVVPGCRPVKAEQDPYFESRRELDEAIQDNAVDSLDFQLGICLTRAQLVLQAHGEHQALLRIQQSYKKAFDAALAADPALAGVKSPQEDVKGILATCRQRSTAA